MSWGDAAVLSLRSLRRRGARSLLAGMGIALGTTLLVALLSIAGTADSRIVKGRKYLDISDLELQDAEPVLKLIKEVRAGGGK